MVDVFFKKKIKIIKDWVMLQQPTIILYDRVILWLTIGLISIGLVMVASTSMLIGSRLFGDSFYFVKRNILYIGFSFVISLFILKIPISVWYRYNFILLIVSFFMLLLVLLVGHSVNGSLRWLSFGSLCIQPAELAKLSLFCYLSSYLARKIDGNFYQSWIFYKPIVIMLIMFFLVLLQPDLGTATIMFVTTLSVLFIAGIALKYFFLFFFITILIIISLIIIEPYRIQRILAFWNPWSDPFGSGYQLTQSLIAFGRGELWGQGLGNSIQKMEYLPEVHTDFIFAILGEELGYCGVFLILLMIFAIIFRALSISNQAFRIGRYFSGFLSCSIGVWLNIQTVINIGVTIGILPTKGLTLPFISYGGSSFIVMFIVIMLLLRIDFELRISRI
ncbi:cell division protein FtsW [Blochmannia endosymbiont of Camponotus (Colobopsis) obliquus]|uniref:cell division protein FtsW n=1 Tax=Blochmannia endosymbiont of Camponotus (Colobopsis) obliquus TaxID=1505597 RepID=UPI00061A805E|nr:cell division protein FtsW [Blochmannia endosymbiont of Camponotus (Colobopsis) obliquus]AKC60316.1 Lipid II flippase FtsW [Blochmannia endosymbiont of Camponotus (Colobopsis) obliquus]